MFSDGASPFKSETVSLTKPESKLSYVPDASRPSALVTTKVPADVREILHIPRSSLLEVELVDISEGSDTQSQAIIDRQLLQ